MRVAEFTEFGPPEVLKTAERDQESPGPGEVRIANRAAGVQRFDTMLRAGKGPTQLVKFPQIPGNEFAGVIDELGEGVNGCAAGDEVIGWRMLGCYAESLIVPADQFVAKPKAMPWLEAGGFNAAAQTASLVLESLNVQEGDTLLINGAAGTTGTVAAQLARYAGAMVVGTASEANHEYLLSLGVAPVQYGKGVADRVKKMAPAGIDAIFDAAGAESLNAVIDLAADKARVKSIGAFGQEDALGITKIDGERSAARLKTMVKLYEQGDLAIYLRDFYPLEEAAAAHAQVETGHGRGKVVLDIDPARG